MKSLTVLSLAPRTLLLLPLLSGCGVTAVSPDQPTSVSQGVAIVCIDPGVAAPAGAVICGQPQTLECGTSPYSLAVTARAEAWCPSARLTVSPSSLSLGSNVVVVRDESVSPVDEVCRSTVTVVDRSAPEVTARTLPLWPPNHQMHSLRAADCVTVRDACDEAPRAVFTWAQVDEPDDATGDGHTTGDVRFDGCDVVAVRAERRGNGDGRVYALGVRVTDRSGNATDAVCHVVVAHDQSGRSPTAAPTGVRVVAPTDCR